MSRDKAGIVGAAAVGVALGAVVGFLLAPDTGRRTRRRLARALGDGRAAVLRKGNQAAGGVSEYLLEQFERSKQALSETANG